MNDKESTLNQLTKFRQRYKFSEQAWNDRGLMASDREMCTRLETLLNDCIDNLILATKAGYQTKNLKKILKDGLDSFKSFAYDTEEREFICEHFHNLSNIVAVDFKDNLNSWLYGKVLYLFIKIVELVKGKEQILETIKQDCLDCNHPLETFILERKSGIPDFCYTVVQCNHCGGYNMVSTGPDVKKLKFGNYRPVEQLLKRDYTDEQANVRLEQIRMFRRK